MAKKKLQNNVKKLPTKTEKACKKVASQNSKNRRLFSRQPASNDNTALGYDLKIACAKFQEHRFIIDGEIDALQKLRITKMNVAQVRDR